MSTPTPRTSAAIIASGFQAVPEGFRAFAGVLERELAALTTERNQLRAEVELDEELQAATENSLKIETIRAERAEAEVERLRSDRDCEKRLRKDADEFKENAIERAMKAEAELATERARLDWLEGNACEIPKYNSRSFIWFANRNFRAAIDKAMKEGAK